MDKLIRNGHFIAQFVDPCDPIQIQPNGVDICVGELFRLKGDSGAILPDRTELAPREQVTLNPNTVLQPGTYVVRYRERITVPDGHVGVVYPRSSLLRNGAMLYSALWDQGYEGRGESLMVLWNPLQVPPESRIGQLVFLTAESAEHYAGQWQHENI